MRLRPRGRVVSLLAWGLLVGGVALLMTFPDGAPPSRIDLRQLPGATLFLLAGLVFGLSHADGRDWLDAAALGWLPLVAGVAVWVDGAAPPLVVWGVFALSPAVLAAAGAGLGAVIARLRSPR